MNKEYYDELKNEIEEFDKKNISNDINERRKKLQKFINSRFSAYPDKNISAVIAFYEYTYNKEEYNWLNEHYTKILSGYFPKDKIENKFDSIVKDNEGLLLNAIISLGNDNVIKDLISVSYEKASQNKDYISIYESIKNKCINVGIDSNKFLDIELKDVAKDDKEISDLGKKVIQSFAIDMPSANLFERQEDNSLMEEHEKRVAAANQKIDKLVSERGLDPSVKPLNKSINLDNFSSSNVSEVEREKRYQEIKENRRLAEEKADKIVEQAANELNVDKKDIYKTLNKQGINPLNLKPGDIVITSNMLRQVSNNNAVEQMNQGRYQRFINKLFSKILFKDSDIKVEVSEIDRSKKVVIAPGNKSQKIAKAENDLIKIQRVSQNVKKYFVDTKNNAKEAIKTTILNLNDKRQALTDSIKENVSNKLYDIADKISGVQENPYDVSNKAEMGNIFFNKNPFKNENDIQFQNYLKGLKDNKVIALSGNLVNQIPHPLLAEASHKSM